MRGRRPRDAAFFSRRWHRRSGIWATAAGALRLTATVAFGIAVAPFIYLPDRQDGWQIFLFFVIVACLAALAVKAGDKQAEYHTLANPPASTKSRIGSTATPRRTNSGFMPPIGSKSIPYEGSDDGGPHGPRRRVITSRPPTLMGSDTAPELSTHRLYPPLLQSGHVAADHSFMNFAAAPDIYSSAVRPIMTNPPFRFSDLPFDTSNTIGGRMISETNSANEEVAVAASGDSIIRKINRKLDKVNEPPVKISADELALLNQSREAIFSRPEPSEYDVFISYAHSDGEQVAKQLKEKLEYLEVTVWFDVDAMRAGKSLARQMDRGLQKAKAGIVVLTPDYVRGGFWTEHELGVILHMESVFPILHHVTFTQLAKFSAFLKDRIGFETARETLIAIAAKLAVAVKAPNPEL